MSIALYRITQLLILISGIIVSVFYSPKIGLASALALGFILAFAHRKGKRPSTKQKHTERRAGEIYDEVQNEKKGEKNKKYKKDANPNKKRNKTK